IQQGAAGGVQLDDEGVLGAGELTLVGRGRVGDGEVARPGAAGDVGVAGGVHGEGPAFVVVAAAEVGGVQQDRAGAVQLGDEGVEHALRGLEVAADGEVGREGRAGQVGTAGGVDGDRLAVIGPAAAQVAGVV